ncbi:MAG: hemerythrin family protein [Terriglobales bacterium]
MKAIDALGEYCTKHFADEEESMLSIGFPGLDEHRRKHRDFVAKVAEYKADLATVNPLHASKVIKLIADWIRDHVLGLHAFANEGNSLTCLAERIALNTSVLEEHLNNSRPVVASQIGGSVGN